MEKVEAFSGFADRLRLIRRSVAAVSIGILVEQVIRRRYGAKNTPTQYGGWTDLNIEDLTTIEYTAPVIPLKGLIELRDNPDKVLNKEDVIGVGDIPLGPALRPDLSLVPRLIVIEDIPT